MNSPRTFPLPSNQPSIREFLKNRRSNMSKFMTEPGPAPEVLSEILEIAARVPDHRKLAPWRFILFEGEARLTFGQKLAEIFKTENPDAEKDKVDFEANRINRAPVVVAVISSPVDCVRGTPVWEQELSSAIVCYNMCLAAQSFGFGAQWLTEWMSYNEAVKVELSLTETERVAGFIYIGTTETPSSARARPDISVKLSRYSS